ncbi:MAG: DUF4129 domain-containing protein [Flavobacteriales bacterium]|nr:DUF4129 domain-containing protein [Flavobacteriales bacterium]
MWGISQDMYLDEDIEKVEIMEKEWVELVSDRDYSEQADKEVEEESDLSIPSVNWSALGWVKYLLLIILVAIVVFLLVKVISSKGNTKLSNEAIVYSELDDIEDDLNKADLESFLEKALSKGDYRLAFRVLYLMALKEMERKNWIDYRKEKTNFNYVFELREREELGQFIELTRAFEKAWYGEYAFGKSDYEKMNPSVRGFVNRVRGNEG